MMMQIEGCGSSNPSRRRYRKQACRHDKGVPHTEVCHCLTGGRRNLSEKEVEPTSSGDISGWRVCGCVSSRHWALVLGWGCNSNDTSSNSSGALIAGDAVRFIILQMFGVFNYFCHLSWLFAGVGRGKFTTVTTRGNSWSASRSLRPPHIWISTLEWTCPTRLAVDRWGPPSLPVCQLNMQYWRRGLGRGRTLTAAGKSHRQRREKAGAPQSNIFVTGWFW